MNTRGLDRSRLGFAVAVSVAVHLGVGAAIGLEAGSTKAFADLEQRSSVQLPPITLGREHSMHDTLTWIGYEEPTPHEAPLAPVEQAAMSLTPPTPASPRTEPSPAAMSAEMVERIQDTARQVEEWGRKFDASAARMVEMLTMLSDQQGEKPEKDADEESTQGEVLAQHPNAKPQQSPTTDSGNAQEQESDGTSTTEPANIRMGKPATAQGLFIRTVRPTYGLVTRATARPADPVLEVEFLRDGSVEQVHIERSSGNEQVDRAIVDAVYMWTAEGERLGKLGEGETASIRIRISL